MTPAELLEQKVAAVNGANDPDEAAKNKSRNPVSQPPVVHSQDQSILSKTKTQSAKEKERDADKHSRSRLIDWLQLVSNVILVLVGICAVLIYGRQLEVFRKQFAEIQTQTKTQQDQLNLSQRPWVKIKHRIIEPLTFNVQRWKGPVATIVIEDIVENVGPTVALNVDSWEDVLPLDPDSSSSSARVRRSEMCNSLRKLNPKVTTQGYMLFPKDPMVQISHVGPPMEVVKKAATTNPDGLKGKVGFVLVGCVSYRSAFEPVSNPAHETQFMYYLARPVQNDGIQPYVLPSGIAEGLQLIAMPEGFSAD